MNVLQRKMFAAGDVATNSFVDPYDEFQPYELDFNIEPKGEGYVAIQRNPRDIARTVMGKAIRIMEIILWNEYNLY